MCTSVGMHNRVGFDIHVSGPGISYAMLLINPASLEHSWGNAYPFASQFQSAYLLKHPCTLLMLEKKGNSLMLALERNFRTEYQSSTRQQVWAHERV